MLQNFATEIGLGFHDFVAVVGKIKIQSCDFQVKKEFDENRDLPQCSTGHIPLQN